jgi:hypothetical protein
MAPVACINSTTAHARGVSERRTGTAVAENGALRLLPHRSFSFPCPFVSARPVRPAALPAAAAAAAAAALRLFLTSAAGQKKAPQQPAMTATAEQSAEGGAGGGTKGTSMCEETRSACVGGEGCCPTPSNGSQQQTVPRQLLRRSDSFVARRTKLHSTHAETHARGHQTSSHSSAHRHQQCYWRCVCATVRRTLSCLLMADSPRRSRRRAELTSLWWNSIDSLVYCLTVHLCQFLVSLLRSPSPSRHVVPCR